MKNYILIIYILLIFALLFFYNISLQTKPFLYEYNTSCIFNEKNQQLRCKNAKNTNTFEIFKNCEDPHYPVNLMNKNSFYKFSGYKKVKLKYKTDFFSIYHSEQITDINSISIINITKKIAEEIKTIYSKISSSDRARIMMNEMQAFRKFHDKSAINISLVEYNEIINLIFCLAKNSNFFLYPSLYIDDVIPSFRSINLIKHADNTDIQKLKETHEVYVAYYAIFDIWNQHELRKYLEDVTKYLNKGSERKKNI